MTPAIRRLLVPIDFSAGSDRASEYAAVLATALGASIHLLHVIEESFATHEVWECDAFDVSARRERAVRESEARLAAIAAGFASTGATVTIEVRCGRAAREILAVAERRGTDLVVMGTHGLYRTDAPALRECGRARRPQSRLPGSRRLRVGRQLHPGNHRPDVRARGLSAQPHSL